jgi:hypothetical protein
MEASMTAIYTYFRNLFIRSTSNRCFFAICKACRIKCLKKAWSAVMFKLRMHTKTLSVFVPDTEYGLNDAMNLKKVSLIDSVSLCLRNVVYWSP